MPAPSAAAAAKAADDLEQMLATLASQEHARSATNAAAEVARLNAEIHAYDVQRDKELSTLQARLDYLRLNMAGAPAARDPAVRAAHRPMACRPCDFVPAMRQPDAPDRRRSAPR